MSWPKCMISLGIVGYTVGMGLAYDMDAPVDKLWMGCG